MSFSPSREEGQRAVREENMKFADEIEERSQNASPKVERKIRQLVGDLDRAKATHWSEIMQGQTKEDILGLLSGGNYIGPNQYQELREIYKGWTTDELKELHRVLFGEEPKFSEEDAKAVPIEVLEAEDKKKNAEKTEKIEVLETEDKRKSAEEAEKIRKAIGI